MKRLKALHLKEAAELTRDEMQQLKCYMQLI